MRGLAFIALLFAGSAVGAELRQAEVCTDGTTHQSGYCPAVLSSASCSATGATTGSCSATSDEADGTRYVCATSSATALTGAEIEACSGGTAVAGATPAAETGSNSVSLSGLTTDAVHYGQIVNESPEGWYSNRLVSSSFTPTDPGGALWDLFGARSVPSQFSSLSWPTAPTTTSTSSASSLSALNTAAAIDGREVTLDGGTYSGNVSITGDDVHVILSGATITGGLSISGTRVRVTGGRFNHSTVVSISTDDILLYNVNLQAQSSSFFQANGNSSIEISNNVNRLALVLVTVNNEYSARAIYQSAIGGANGSDLIIAGSDLIGINSNGWGPRINGSSRTIIVDTRIRVTSPSQTGRYHADHPSAVITGYYAARNQIEEGTWNNNPFSSTGVTPGSMTGIYFYDNNFYRNSTFGQLAFAGHDGGSISTVRAEDNTHYTLANGGVGTMQIDVSSVTDYSGSNNVRAPYTTPPAFAYGSDQ